MPAETVLFVIEIIGVISFSISGTLVALRKNADVVGAIVLTLMLTFAGGMTRDLILGVTPPHIFWDKEYGILALVSASVSFVCFHIAFIPKISAFLQKNAHNFWLELADAVGLAVFCIFGVEAAKQHSADIGLAIFCGCLTGVGGGIIRDVCCAEIPMIFRKRVYFLPTVAGSAIYTLLLLTDLDRIVSMTLSIALIVIVRMLAYHFKWNLPRPKGC